MTDDHIILGIRITDRVKNAAAEAMAARVKAVGGVKVQTMVSGH